MIPGTLARSLVNRPVTMRTPSGNEYHGRLVETPSGDLAVQTSSGNLIHYVAGCTLQARDRGRVQ